MTIQTLRTSYQAGAVDLLVSELAHGTEPGPIVAVEVFAPHPERDPNQYGPTYSTRYGTDIGWWIVGPPEEVRAELERLELQEHDHVQQYADAPPTAEDYADAGTPLEEWPAHALEELAGAAAALELQELELVTERRERGR